MRKLSVTAALAPIAILLASPAALAQGQSAGQGTGKPSSPQLSPPPPAGSNSVGTAQSSGGKPNTGEGVTTGSANAQSIDQAIANENRSIDRRLKGICRGC
ncbi:hypothetical protein MTX26_13795 [Bradyrhizobium sp. ISRA443]|uniref:hypothetical protein n=1 Tax=unclassified Bradyrhizobium TaxID=2631580 RepID=UPI00247A923A|nr:MULTISPECIES: hypothetical protein [unclassified Bradyrhizobium]WGR91536.1 hypothetical protein MTX20_24295 [Bradyrhizobium sp. ISRA435]WGS01824.1 hypothetical protein MTX23_13805 [Bradyrhizobium sp. ISRA436]WGS08710.1 hypothetical protein MTX18_13795 [Bradyrhizobium sp. ISRA437]WGS15598.1 hypothetical protein MTX26_13795 [Bradyrhizobium sp. ISRA443]